MTIYVNARFLTQPVSGVQRYGIECSRQIKRLHPETIFLAPGNIIHKDIAKEFEVITVGKNTGHIWEQIDLPLYMSRKRAPLLNLANTAPLAYRNSYVTIHDLAFYHHPEWNSKIFATWYNILVPRIAHRSRHIFTVSETMRGELVKYYDIPGKKISVTYNGIAQQMLNVGQGSLAPKEKIILSVGSFNKRKNHQHLVSAFLEGNIKATHQLVLIGDKYKVFSESGLNEAALQQNNIRILHGLAQDELINMYRKAEVVVSLSLYEGFGIPVLEGLYYGCKAVCSDIAVYHELYEQYATFCNPVQEQSISMALEKAVAATARPDISRLLHRYSYEHAAEVILDIIKTGG